MYKANTHVLYNIKQCKYQKYLYILPKSFQTISISTTPLYVHPGEIRLLYFENLKKVMLYLVSALF